MGTPLLSVVALLLSPQLPSCVYGAKLQMVKQAGGSENWGWAKALFAQALEDGVDVTDEEEMQDFVDRLNEEIRRKTSDPKGANWPFPER